MKILLLRNRILKEKTLNVRQSFLLKYGTLAEIGCLRRGYGLAPLNGKSVKHTFTELDNPERKIYCCVGNLFCRERTKEKSVVCVTSSKHTFRKRGITDRFGGISFRRP